MSQTLEKESSSGAGTRVGSLIALVAVVTGILYAARVGFYALTDSFVAPITLSPDSDIVIASSLKLNEVYAERAKMVAERERIDADIQAGEIAIQRLRELQKVADRAGTWTNAVTKEQARAGAADLEALRERERRVKEMLEKQEDFVAETQKNLEAGLVAKADAIREAQALSQLRLVAVDTERARLATELQVTQTQLARRALDARGPSGTPLMPEMIAQRSQSVHIELDLVKLEAERRAGVSKKAAVVAELAKIDEMTAQMRSRPLYRAIEERTNVAFVPYTQMKGVVAAAPIFQCRWGIFDCRQVGTVGELLPGEVVMPDPWGSLARGQYAMLALTDGEAAQAKVLRVRAGRQTSSAPSTSNRDRFSLR